MPDSRQTTLRAQSACPHIGLIWAQARNGVIGSQGTMPWHLPEDLAHFKRNTLNFPVIMGRRTWDSIPARFRPLPDRVNIVITRQSGWTAPGATAVPSLEDALCAAGDAPQVWIMGGGQVFRAALPLADRLLVTRIDADFAGDTFAPAVDASWTLTASQPCQSASGLLLHFETWQRKPAPSA